MAFSMGGRGFRADINMTPMIDVLLVLIIIFMVITPVPSTGLDTLIPQPREGPDPPAPAHDIVISILADGSFQLNQEPIAHSLLESRLEGLYKRAATAPVFIHGDRSLEYWQVAEVIDIAKQAGIGRVALMGN